MVECKYIKECKTAKRKGFCPFKDEEIECYKSSQHDEAELENNFFINTEVENILLSRLKELKKYDKKENEKVSEFNQRKHIEYERWSTQIEIYLLLKIRNGENKK